VEDFSAMIFKISSAHEKPQLSISVLGNSRFPAAVVVVNDVS
jgi:hypothetical protein